MTARKAYDEHTTVTATATEPLAGFHLDLLLPATSVRVDGRRAAFSRPNRHELRVVPASPIAAGQSFRVQVQYTGRPGEVAWGGERAWVANRHEIVTMGEPHMAAWWFPANDHPRDKATFDISVRVPRGRHAVSNGRLLERRIRQQDGKFLTAVPRHGIFAPHGAAEDFSNRGQHLVSRQVAALVVEFLEVVHVQHQQREHFFPPIPSAHPLFQPVVEFAAVGQASERIGQ